jgi:hypothetical protein
VRQHAWRERPTFPRHRLSLRHPKGRHRPEERGDPSLRCHDATMSEMPGPSHDLDEQPLAPTGVQLDSPRPNIEGRGVVIPRQWPRQWAWMCLRRTLPSCQTLRKTTEEWQSIHQGRLLQGQGCSAGTVRVQGQFVVLCAAERKLEMGEIDT